MKYMIEITIICDQYTWKEFTRKYKKINKRMQYWMKIIFYSNVDLDMIINKYWSKEDSWKYASVFIRGWFGDNNRAKNKCQQLLLCWLCDVEQKI